MLKFKCRTIIPTNCLLRFLLLNLKRLRKEVDLLCSPHRSGRHSGSRTPCRRILDRGRSCRRTLKQKRKHHKLILRSRRRNVETRYPWSRADQEVEPRSKVGVRAGQREVGARAYVKLRLPHHNCWLRLRTWSLLVCDMVIITVYSFYDTSL